MKKNRIFKEIALGGVLLAVLSMTGCTIEDVLPDYTESRVKKQKQEEIEEITGGKETGELLTKIGSLPIEDNFSLYEDWGYDEITTMYLTVRSGNESDGTNHTWEEVNTYSSYYYDERGIDRYKVEGLLQVGDENGPVEGELGYNQYVPNSVVQIRGQTSTRNAQKNYRINLSDGKGDWNGMKTINLNKHMGDGTRIINMLCYHLMTQIDGMMSARTKFVHLYVKDETGSGDGTDTFVDYGLYTFVEQINKTYLRSHNLNRNGQLYKINFFEFHPYEDVIMLKSDSRYDLAAFERHLEIKGDDNHSKLMQMLEELNDYSIPIEETFEKWFDEENYFSWLAFHILVGNRDTSSRNHFLYSPNNVNKFYYISWDNDAAFRNLSKMFTSRNPEGGFEIGISNYCGNILHRRVLLSEELRKKLDDKILELRAFLSPEKMKEEAEFFAAMAKPYLFSMPDVINAPLLSEEFDEVIASIPAEVENNYQKYLLSLEKPMPFFLGVPNPDGDKLRFNWDNAYDFDAETITYQFELAKDYYFTDCIYEEENILIPEITTDMLPPGQYFWRVTCKNESGYEQTAFDYYVSDKGKEYGIKCFWVTGDGSIEEEVNVE